MRSVIILCQFLALVTVAANAASPKVTRGMVRIPAGTFSMGCGGCNLPDAEPVHQVAVSSFWMDEVPVTNAAFAKFVDKTGYMTYAERSPDPALYPGVARELLVPGSAVFRPSQRVSLGDPLSWWVYEPGASWKHPEGARSDISKRQDHPAVHIAYPDAEAYCTWMKKRLPTEAEFERAARGGLEKKRYAWGDDLKPGGKWPANIWQGNFPLENSEADGYRGTSPVRAFPANGFGLYDMGGNVWQWTSDWYRPETYEVRSRGANVRDPHGPVDSLDPREPGVPKRVQRGGSFLCSDHYCTRYLVGSRGKGAPNDAGSNIGFRCVVSDQDDADS